jgi:hypothetical protein
MRYFPAFFVTLILVALLAAIPRSGRCQDEAVPPNKPDVKVSLAVVEGHQSSTPQRVIIENISDKPQSHFDEWNSWGYGNLTLQWTDAEGRTGTIAKVPGAWDQNGPSTTVLQPGEALVREITDDPKLWQGWPGGNGSITLTVKVTYQSTGEPKIAGSAAGWTGTVTSKEKTISIWRPVAP